MWAVWADQEVPGRHVVVRHGCIVHTGRSSGIGHSEILRRHPIDRKSGRQYFTLSMHRNDSRRLWIEGGRTGGD